MVKRPLIQSAIFPHRFVHCRAALLCSLANAGVKLTRNWSDKMMQIMMLILAAVVCGKPPGGTRLLAGLPTFQSSRLLQVLCLPGDRVNHAELYSFGSLYGLACCRRHAWLGWRRGDYPRPYRGVWSWVQWLFGCMCSLQLLHVGMLCSLWCALAAQSAPPLPFPHRPPFPDGLPVAGCAERRHCPVCVWLLCPPHVVARAGARCEAPRLLPGLHRHQPVWWVQPAAGWGGVLLGVARDSLRLTAEFRLG